MLVKTELSGFAVIPRNNTAEALLPLDFAFGRWLSPKDGAGWHFLAALLLKYAGNLADAGAKGAVHDHQPA